MVRLLTKPRIRQIKSSKNATRVALVLLNSLCLSSRLMLSKLQLELNPPKRVIRKNELSFELDEFDMTLSPQRLSASLIEIINKKKILESYC